MSQQIVFHINAATVSISGEGPFPTVIDLFGMANFIEARSALLASRGFASFALAYTYYKDLPKLENSLDFNYFLVSPNIIVYVCLSTLTLFFFFMFFLADHDSSPICWIFRFAVSFVTNLKKRKCFSQTDVYDNCFID